jgi:hypothetical protein
MLGNDLIKILLIEDEEFDIQRVKNTIKPFNDIMQLEYVVSSGSKALELISSNMASIDIVVMDYQIAGGLMGEVRI